MQSSNIQILEPAHNEEIPNSQQEGFTSVYRKKGVKILGQTPEQSIKNVKILLKTIRDRYATKNAIGQIVVTKQKNENGEQIERRVVRAHTYAESYEKSFNLGKALFSRKLFFQEELYKMKLLGIYSKNRYEWFLTDWACCHFGMSTVPLYDTLGLQNLSYCLNQTGITTIFVSSATGKTLLKLNNIGQLKNIVSFDPLDEQTLKLLQFHKLNYFNFWDLLNEGSLLQDVNDDNIVVTPDDCYTFSYTSGTTGPPKGVIMTHRSIISGLTTYCSQDVLKFNGDDRYLSHLPLPHIMERGVSLTLFYLGALVVVSSGNILKLKEDLQTIKATVFISVPRIFNRIVQGVKSKFSDNDLESNQAERNESIPNFYYNNVFPKVRQSFGGCIRVMGTGSAPINFNIISFMKQMMNCPMVEGYGQTQCCGSALFSKSSDSDLENLSQICEGLEVRLCDIPQMKYTSKDVNQKGQLTPRGQIWLRGPQLFKGYYKLPEANKQTIVQGGWLRTGDVAEIVLKNKGFKIIDRRKNIFKLQQGQYLAPDRIESIYLRCKLVEEVFLHGNPHQYFPVIIITPNKHELQRIARSKDINGSYEDLCTHKQIKISILKEINTVGKSHGLNGFEFAKNIFLEPKGFLSKNIYTNTMKLIRFEARQVYKQVIAQLYKQGQLI